MYIDPYSCIYFQIISHTISEKIDHSYSIHLLDVCNACRKLCRIYMHGMGTNDSLCRHAIGVYTSFSVSYELIVSRHPDTSGTVGRICLYNGEQGTFIDATVSSLWKNTLPNGSKWNAEVNMYPYITKNLKVKKRSWKQRATATLTKNKNHLTLWGHRQQPYIPSCFFLGINK